MGILFNKIKIVPNSHGTPTPTPTGGTVSPTPTPSATPTPTPTPSPTPNEFGIITENGVYIFSDENGNTLIPE
jgi:hypothetical protein